MKSILKITAAAAAIAAFAVSCENPASPTPPPPAEKGVVYAGVRSSRYGVPHYNPNPSDPASVAAWPTPAEFGTITGKMGEYFPGAEKAAIWIVGHLQEEGCGLEFDQPAGYAGTDPNIVFAGTPTGGFAHAPHEDYLNYFDQNGIKVWLQVESGKGDVKTLIDLVLNQYKHHPSVIGFGVDVEWYNTTTPVGEDAGEVVADAVAKEWEAAVKAHNPNYTLFLKHYDKTWMCPDGYRGDIVFCDDSCFFRDSNSLVTEFKAFADHFYPNTVLYQVGYQLDQPWWSLLDAEAVEDYGLPASVPPQALGRMLDKVTRQDCGIMWVDFTMNQVLPPYVTPRI